jgi:hypothetical protein
MSDTTERLPILDPIAFAGALVLAPLLVAALFFWIILIPVAAVFFGGLPYLVFGGPVFLWMVTRYPPDFGTFAVGGLAAHALFVLSLALWQMSDDYQGNEILGFMALWGLPFCLGWGGAFSWLYAKFYRSPVRHFVH